jgi:hypothetical protein
LNAVVQRSPVFLCHPGHLQRVRAAERGRLLGVDRISKVQRQLGEGRMCLGPHADDDAVGLLLGQHALEIAVGLAPEPARVPLRLLGVEVAYADDLGARGADVRIDALRGERACADDAEPGILFGLFMD